MSGKYDVVVIGAGPGGYVAAIKAAKLGLKTAIIEERRAGGTCLNRGCIPAKAMIHASSLYREMQEAERFGISASDVTYDYGKIVAYREETTDKLVQGVEQLLKANGVDVYEGKGTLLEEKKVRIRKEQEDVVLEGENIILASGSKPLILPIPGIDSERVLTSDALFAMKEAPKSLIIIGGGVISVEFATVYANLGCKITILEAMPKLVPNMDKEISQNLKMILKKRGIDIHTSAAVQGVTTEDGTCTCHYIEKDQEQEVTADYVLCAVGRCPNTDGLFGENVKPDMERGRVLVNANFESSIPGVYAIGDLIFGVACTCGKCPGNCGSRKTCRKRTIHRSEYCSGMCLYRSGDRICRNDRRSGKRKWNCCKMRQVHHECKWKIYHYAGRTGLHQSRSRRSNRQDPGSSDDVCQSNGYDRRICDCNYKWADCRADAQRNAVASDL